jgi:hypothetical protein
MHFQHRTFTFSIRNLRRGYPNPPLLLVPPYSIFRPRRARDSLHVFQEGSHRDVSQNLGRSLLVPVPHHRSDLVAVLVDSKAWCLRCIGAGETNIKGYLLICVLAAPIGGLGRRLGKDELPKLLIKAAEDAEEKCLPILAEMVAKLTGDGLLQISMNTPPGVNKTGTFW